MSDHEVTMAGQGVGRGPDGQFARRVPQALPDLAVITIELDRSTGEVKIHDEFSTPMETWAMLSTASELASIRIDRANGVEATGD